MGQESSEILLDWIGTMEPGGAVVSHRQFLLYRAVRRAHQADEAAWGGLPAQFLEPGEVSRVLPYRPRRG